MYYIYIDIFFPANEFRAWLLHYSVPVLRGILPNLYLSHFATLVWAVHTLLLDRIPKMRLALAEKLCDDFNRLTLTLYG